jgi:NAD+ synthase (glutamine-hydrolysing)
VRVLLGQLSTVVGDVEGNARLCHAALQAGRDAGARLVLLPELALSGYPPRDLLQRGELVGACARALEGLAAATRGGPVLLVGLPWRDAGGLRNAAAVCADGRVAHVVRKALLPTYDVFDEGRYFAAEPDPRPVEVDGLRLGVTICEDLWNEEGLVPPGRYAVDPIARMVGCDLVCNLSASPFHAGKGAVRLDLVRRQAAQAGAPLLYCNLVGGNDELLFDGDSLVVGADGRLLAQGPAFAPGHLLVDLDGPAVAHRSAPFEAEVHAALVMGIRDYAARCGFERAVLGLSGGIDSALVAALAVDALGADRVLGVGMPGPFSSAGSVDDAVDLAGRLGCRFERVGIGAIHDAFLGALAPLFAGRAPDVTEENLQARARGTLLMAVSNKLGHLLLTTGNKSEMAVGYCTLYGDMNGGLAPLADLYKTEVYRLARWMNRDGERIPRATLEKAPSAELAPDQKDQDSLPPYAVLDAVLRDYVEGEAGEAELCARGHDPAVVRQVVRLVERSEFKRWQAAPGLRISQKAFGIGRRIPLARRWRMG